MKLVDVSVKRPVGVIMFVLVALVLGAISLKSLPIDLYPDMEIPVAVVVTSYDGAAPQEVEELITRPIESVVGTIEGVVTIESVSQPGSSLVAMQFDWGQNIDESMNDIREKVDQVSAMLPDDAGKPRILKIDLNSTPIMWVGLKGAPLEKLQQIAEDEIAPAFERVPGVASVAVEGGKTREIQVELDQTKMALYGITGSQVAQAIGAENRSASAGNLTRGAQELQLRIDGEFTTIKDIENTQISLKDGSAIKVTDVATVKDTFKKMTTKAVVNGEEGLILSIMKQSDGNTVEVSDGMRKAIADISKDLEADGLELKLIMDTADFIRQAIDSVSDNMIVGGVLAMIVIFVFLRNIRTTIIIGLSIPIAVISTFVLMYFTGETLNILSMGGLALGIGMMVDSSIVVLENIFVKQKQGLPLIDAAREGASELGSALLASTLTTIVVFLPIVFVEGLASQIFRPLSLTVAFSLTASLVVALTLIPMLSSKLLKKVVPLPDDMEQMSKFDRMFTRVQNLYGKGLEWALRRRKTTIAITTALVIGSLALIPYVGTEFIPASDQGQIQIGVVTQEGSELEETAEVIFAIDAKLEPYRDMIDTYYASIGGGNGFGEGTTNEATFIMQLVPASEREMTTTQFMKELNALTQDIPGADITVMTIDAGAMGSGSSIQLFISGDDMDVLKDLAQQVMWVLEDIPGTTNVDSSIEQGRPELTIKVDRALANAYGLSFQQIMSEVTLGFTGQVATRYREDGSEFDVRVMFPEDSRQSIRDLETLTIRNNQGVEIPLTAVAELRQVQGPMQISRKDQERQIQVTGDILDRDLGSVMTDIEAAVARMNLPDGYRISFGGEMEEMMDAFGQLALAFVLSVFLVYMVMAVQFESFKQPFIIMFSMPTMIVGATIGLFVTGQTLNVTSIIGLIMLAGIVVNNAIILVDYTNILRDRGMEKIEAIILAGKSRLRPILMTTLTTVLGMVPLALGIGEGTESQMPMAIVVIFGLSTSTFFTLFLIPVIYSIERKKKKKKNEQQDELVEVQG